MQSLRIIGVSPFDAPRDGAKVPHIGTLLPDDAVLVTVPGIHATQRMAYVHWLGEERRAAGCTPPAEPKEGSVRDRAVDLFFQRDVVLIRPDPSAMDLAFAADELLQAHIPKRRIRFLHLNYDEVRLAIKRRGEAWRISTRPRAAPEIADMIAQSRVGIGGPAIYYYNFEHGTRFLTCAAFASLAALDDAALARQLAEIQRHCVGTNRLHHPELAFHLAAGALGALDFAGVDFPALSPAELRARHAALAARFTAAVPPELRDDNPEDPAWRNHMFLALAPAETETALDAIVPGMSPEFFRQIKWLPGGRIEHGELIFDSIFDEWDQRPDDPELRALVDTRARAIIKNFIREVGTLEYVNVGFIMPSVRHHAVAGEGHSAYIAELQQAGAPRPVVRILRFAKWGSAERLERHHQDLLEAFVETEKYIDYIFDRRLGCWQLGMRLPERIIHRRIPETYQGSRAEFRGRPIWVHYFERDYISGTATDKIPARRYQEPAFAAAFARLLGEAAAPNLIVGRMTADGKKVIFDDGDEILIETAEGLPREIVAADHAGTFVDTETPLVAFAADYAAPVVRRAADVPDARAFGQIYLASLLARFRHLQDDYRKRRRAFDNLFKYQPQEHGSLAWRWANVLARLDQTDPAALAKALSDRIQV
jgi:hypothetical protein